MKIWHAFCIKPALHSSSGVSLTEVLGSDTRFYSPTMSDMFASPAPGKRLLTENPPIVMLPSVLGIITMDDGLPKAAHKSAVLEMGCAGELACIDFESHQDTLPFSPDAPQNFSLSSLTSPRPLLHSTLRAQSPRLHASRQGLLELSMSSDGHFMEQKPQVNEPLSSSKHLSEMKFTSTAFFTVTKRKQGENSEEENQADREKDGCNFQAAKRTALQLPSELTLDPVKSFGEEKLVGYVDKVSSSRPEHRLSKNRLLEASRRTFPSPVVPVSWTSASGFMSQFVKEGNCRMSYPHTCMDVGTRKTVDLSKPAVSSGESLEAVEMRKDRLEVLGYETATTGFLSVAYKKDSSMPEDFLEVDQEHQARFSLGALSNPAKGRQGGEDSAVTVAIRVRPLNSREQKMKAKSVVSVSGQETTVHPPHSQQKFSFSFDFSFWSCDAQDGCYASQETVYESLARPLLDKVFQGYNACLFAYGQTGSGKSYTMMGYNEEAGIIPRFCEEIFLKAAEVKEDNVTCHIEMSYFEVYNEKLHDLLTSDKEKNKTKKTSLRIREHPELGPYVAGLSKYVVGSFADVQAWLELGNKQRATAATGMNDKSSRSHSVFTMVATQTKRETSDGESLTHTMRSHVNLVDLAGSERSSSAQTSGMRLKEGASINRSLMTLGKVISALSEATQSKKKPFIPYRDSLLTWLLKESLGGNSKTAMLATVSPAAVNLEETLSTLRYAKQARSIINVAKVNEDSNARIIRELKAEIEKLRAFQRCSQGTDSMKSDSSLHEILSLKQKLLEQEKKLTEAQQEWKENLARAEQCKLEEARELQKAGVSFKVDNRLPNLVNLNEDPQLSEMLLYIIKEGQTKVGRHMVDSEYDIQLTGALIADSHCLITNEQGTVTLTPAADAETYVNGDLVSEPVTLHHGDRVILGRDHYFRFNHPVEVQNGRRASEGPVACKEMLQDFEFAKNELVESQKQRIEAEIEEARLQAQQEMMQELQTARDLAQRELSAQRCLYEEQIRELQKEMEDELSMKQELLSKEMEQKRHKHLGKLLLTEPSTQELEESQLRHRRFMEALQLEKEKLAREMAQVQQARLSREEERKSAARQGKSKWGSLRLSALLEEANTISRVLKKPVTFTRNEYPSVSEGAPSVHVRVTNSELGASALWDLQTFEGKLLSMREYCQGSYGGCDEDVFRFPTDVEVKSHSPLRQGNSLSQQRSDQLVEKVYDSALVLDTGCVTVCKQLLHFAMEALEREQEAGSLTEQLLLDLRVVTESAKAITQTYQQLPRNSATMFQNPDLQTHGFSAATSLNSMVTLLRLWGTFISLSSSQSAILDSLATELKILGGSLTLLLHGCESDIESMVKESKEKMNQSSLCFASQLGRLLVSMGPEGSFMMIEKCSLEQAELFSASLKEALMRGADEFIESQVSAGISSVDHLESHIWTVASEKMTEDAKKGLGSFTSSLTRLMDRSKAFWEQILSLKKEKTEQISDAFLKENFTLYKVLNSELTGLLKAGENIYHLALEYFTADDPSPQMLKQCIESVPKAAETLSKTLSSLWTAVCDESQDQSAIMNREADAAVRELHSSAGQLLKLLERERQRAFDCRDSRSCSQTLTVTLHAAVGEEWGPSSPHRG
ncbi:kinesin-like protein KIF14 isoform X3 [Acipenser ruthenus]|uniref:kinesin-like protein KIF14 isoform X3 n=1 Tax=Acipenser ruthenus TaxID=7906 RepID=UPI0027419F3D|nr:kinesin-like protein KIF14 isoform X3 [Acipenser ruthenus]